MTFRVIAHRGVSADAPDNSREAFDLAVEQQADLIETDVQVTLDGVLILVHDFDISGQSVATHRHAELLAIKPHLVTLAQALVAYGDKIPFCWEVKANGVEAALVQMVKDMTSDVIWEQTEFTSFHWGSAVMLRQLAPDNPVGWLTPDWNESVITRVAEADLSQICPPAQAVIDQLALVKTAHDVGLDVRVWAVSDPDMIPPLVDADIYGATVNWAGVARRIMER